MARLGSLSQIVNTGRAARILGRKTGKPSKTIHSEIYELGDIKADEHSDTIQGDFDSPGFTIPFKLKDGADTKAAVYIVDESSMVSDKTTQSEILSFGSGRLLHDLLHYARIINNKNIRSKILFVGDEAQLPPIHCSDSPALLKSYFLTEFKIDSDVFRLNKVLRQTEGSLILENAEKIRNGITTNNFGIFHIKEDGNTVNKVGPFQAVENAVMEHDAGNSVIITVSNKDALSYNLAIRRRRFGTPDIIDRAAHDSSEARDPPKSNDLPASDVNPKKRSGTWKKIELEMVCELWKESGRGSDSIKMISLETGRSSLAIIIQLYKAKLISVEQGDSLCQQCDCANVLSKAILLQ
jgi:hypothetical protein